MTTPFYGPQMQKVAATPLAGVALINGTQNIISWTAPSDGQMHRVMLLGALHVTVAETGGSTQMAYNAPDGAGAAVTVWGSGFGAGVFQPNLIPMVTVQPGSTVTFQQNAALTAGAATVFAELWAS